MVMLKDTIVFYRKKNGLSQEELASKLFVSRQTVSQWETGQTLPTIDNLQRLKEIFGVGLDVLLDESAADAAEETKTGGEEQPAPQAAESEKACTNCDQQPAFSDNTAQERFSYTLSEEDIKRGIRNGWTAYLRISVLPMLFPLFIAITERNRALIGAMVVWIVFLIVLYAERWRKKRAKLTEILGGHTTELRVYSDLLTQIRSKDGETVSMWQMKFNEIRRAEDLGTLFRVTDGERVLLIPKNAVPADGVLLHRLEAQVKKSKEQINHVTVLSLIIGTILVDFAVSRIYLSLVGSDGSVANAQAYSWIWLIGLPLPFFCVGYAIAKARKEKKRKVSLIIFGAISILFACSQIFLPGILDKAAADVNSEISQIEESVKITLPEYSNIHITKNVIAAGKKRITQVIAMSMERSVSLAFDREIANDPRWINPAQAERLSQIWNPTYAASNADFVMCVNLTDGVTNEIPSHNGKYRFVNLLYLRETEMLYVVCYEVDYQQ